MRWALLILSTILIWTVTARAERRVALVIGNGQYRHAPDLPNGASDAWAISKALKSLGFEVNLDVEVTRQKFSSKIDRFKIQTKDSDVNLVYYSGHGFQKNGENYLLPIDAKLDSIADLNNSAIPLKDIFNALPKNAINIIFLDSCRNNPLLDRLIENNKSNVELSRGFSSPQLPRGVAVKPKAGRAKTTAYDKGVGTLIAYSTQPGNVAIDGSGEFSPFAENLVQLLATPGLEIRDMLTEVRNRVVQQTRGKQVPWDHSSLTKRFYFAKLDTSRKVDINFFNGGYGAIETKCALGNVEWHMEVNKGKFLCRVHYNIAGSHEVYAFDGIVSGALGLLQVNNFKNDRGFKFGGVIGDKTLDGVCGEVTLTKSAYDKSKIHAPVFQRSSMTAGLPKIRPDDLLGRWSDACYNETSA